MTAEPEVHAAPAADLPAARRRLAVDALAITLSAGAFGIVYGLAARSADFSLAEAMAMSVLVLAGASQFAAVGLVVSGVAWPAIVLLTCLLNARHLLYSAALAPWFRGQPAVARAAAAYALTDETFALSLAHFRRVGRFDGRGYWIASAFVCLPWIVATALGFLGGQALPDPGRLGLDVVFPAAMAGLAVALTTGRRELAAALAAVAIGVGVSLVTEPALGIVAGGLLGPLAGVALPLGSRPATATTVELTEVAATLPELSEPPAETLP
ncbi:MAG: AzlC family ABC transporter permease [Candidatus Limnocylindrales bacterium]